MSGPVLLTSDADGVRTLFLNRPQALNALDRALMEALTTALDDADADPAVGAVLLTGNGTSFCAGADIKEHGGLTSTDLVREHAGRTAALYRRLARMRTPTVAAVHGYALGGGCGLALACDLVVCDEGAVLGYPEIGRGVLPALVLPRLVQLAGEAVAFDLLATGRRVTAMEALALRMVSTVPAGNVPAVALDRARRLAGLDPDLVGRLRALLRDCAGLPLEGALDIARQANEASRIARLMGTFSKIVPTNKDSSA
ncbi:enoyl-CoA hydratase/isomerase family protein [Azospirillum sp. RWY-5-1]|uniref:Enoyl-CoA hydratase/isomerase family protein n=1 Tax=Azospirillum oleiclasticum TaxID=2735135 RepID=A0ABX2TI38_9PROT|nr:enoyl-CoA hydratase/isomerase family protein [Azospirillum oleiclasticum]NYZ16528.1 enoyl-CoA hydratase/isomerase family protein [Azospirillum oleiclasticum]NYZ24002.1 enoyl-CoA hydratase/isomerase family protein [Azospirillum oleiclasticum]